MSAAGTGGVDFDALLDLSEYEAASTYQSPSLSPASSSKATFTSPVTAPVNTPFLSSTSSQAMSGPSHNYDLYRQQTGFVPGAIANTMAVNQTNNTGYQSFGGLDYLSTFSPQDDLFDFNTSPSQGAVTVSDMDMDFDSQNDSQLFSTINPSTIQSDPSALPSPPVLNTSTSTVGRLWPGAHSQAALAKAQAQKHVQTQQMAQTSTTAPKARSKGPHPTDPLVEQKIAQLLSSMRAKPASPDDDDDDASLSVIRSKKDEEDMDEDERLLASEEGKKLTSKERRQLRNKVSARAFRSRRKEYITQLESEIASKVNENGDLKARNRALLEENKRLSDLTRMLLSSSSFSTFLDHLSSNPTLIPQNAPVKAEPAPQQQEQRQIPKDVNPYNQQQQQQQQQQIGVAMIPEQPMDFSMLGLSNLSGFNFQPQVFVVDALEHQPIDLSVLSGKPDSSAESFASNEDKIEVPVIERPLQAVSAPVSAETSVWDEDFESDPEFALFHSETTPVSSPTTKPSTDDLNQSTMFAGIEPEKLLARYELVVDSEEDAAAALVLARVLRISEQADVVASRLEMLTRNL